MQNWIKVCFMMGVLSLSALTEACPALLDHELRMLNADKTVKLCDSYANQVILVVNTASKCGFTPQYEGLEELYKNYQAQGLVVLGFPSNDFAGQEPNNEAQIQDFCRLTYGVQFPMFEKVHVRGTQAHPFYQALTKASGEEPQWNFHKYLLDRNGQLVGNFPSQVKPDDPNLLQQIQTLLAASTQP